MDAIPLLMTEPNFAMFRHNNRRDCNGNKRRSKVKICVIGAGRWGKNHIRTLNGLSLLGGVIESHEDSRNRIREAYPDVRLFNSISDAGAMDFDAYTIATPAPTHFKLASELLSAGKHCLVEKPITLDSEEAEKLTAIASANKCILTTGHLLLFHPAFKKMKSLIDEGKLGKLQYMYSNRLNLGTVRTEENSLWSFAPHDISLFQYFTQHKPINISSNGGAFLQPHIHDTSMTVLYYPENIVGHIFVSWLHPFKEHRFVLIGTKGMLMYEDSSPNKELRFYQKGVDFINGEPIKRDGPTEVISYAETQPLEEEMKFFVEAIKNNQPDNIIDGNKGVEVLKILESADRSIQNYGAPQQLQLKRDNAPYYAHPTAIIAPTASIADDTKIWQYSSVQPGASLGKSCRIGQNVNIGPNVIVGNFCKIQNNVSVYEGVELEDYVFCGPSMVFTNIKAPRSKYPQAASKFYLKTKVKEGASIGANATIVCGTTIGKHALIGAGAVVTKDVPDYAVIIGNPGKNAGWISEGGQLLDFEKEEEIFCEKSKLWYRQIDEEIVTSSVSFKTKV
ncbi:MAG: UDP-2-acetamido-3-amino-2,3-dideoxy-glucuronate N-acetyltransferase [Candidatus Marinamargulisbacteria bacterium]|jgi:UDP-2-acetamido-3-amino-2,3-dideoxy-glucuronate N-acetyltransferase